MGVDLGVFKLQRFENVVCLRYVMEKNGGEDCNLVGAFERNSLYQ